MYTGFTLAAYPGFIPADNNIKMGGANEHNRRRFESIWDA
jgi:hypothetical protein